MKFGQLETKDYTEFRSKNKRVSILITEKKGHMHVRFTGAYTQQGLTSVTSCNKIERAILANYLLKRIDDEGYLSRQDLCSMNRAEVFTSLWEFKGGRK